MIQNHLFQVLCQLAMEPPVRTDSESIRDEKVKVLKAIPPLEPSDRRPGQFRGYRQEPGVSAGLEDGDVRRAAAGGQLLALEGRALLHSRRKEPAGHLYRGGWPLRKPPTAIPGRRSLRRITFGFRISPDVTIAIGTTMAPGEEMIGQQVEIDGQPSPQRGRNGRLRASAGRRDGRRRHPVRPRGLRRRGVADRRPVPENGDADVRIRAKHVGAGRAARHAARRVGQSGRGGKLENPEQWPRMNADCLIGRM